MEQTCVAAPADKKAYITELGNTLVKEYGKKEYYKPEEVKKAHQKSSWADGQDVSCWGMSVFSSHSDFDAHHAETGEVCDYAGMKTEMLQGLAATGSESWMAIPDLDIDASWLDFGDALGGILEGVGEFFAAIGDAL